jgi:hypothetical protein
MLVVQRLLMFKGANMHLSELALRSSHFRGFSSMLGVGMHSSTVPCGCDNDRRQY